MLRVYKEHQHTHNKYIKSQRKEQEKADKKHNKNRRDKGKQRKNIMMADWNLKWEKERKKYRKACLTANKRDFGFIQTQPTVQHH